MTPDPGRVQAVFLAAFDQKTYAARIAVLDRECAADDALRRRVEALLIAHDRPDGVLDRPLIVPGEQAPVVLVRPPSTADENDLPPSDRERN